MNTHLRAAPELGRGRLESAPVSGGVPLQEKKSRFLGNASAAMAYQRFRNVRFFSCLDGLRAISILAVIWHHTAAAAVSGDIAFLQRGNRGVMLFFVISAFLISTLLLRAKERRTLDVPRFWARRALRIMPLFYAVLVLYIVLVYCFERDGTARNAFFSNLPAFATFTSNWFVELDNSRVIFYFAWSLAAEEQFYLCWPWVERYFAGAWPVIVAAVVLVISQCAVIFSAANHSEILALKIVASVPAAILLGVILAHLLNSPRWFAALWSLAGRRGSAVLGAGFTMLALSVEAKLGAFGELLTAFAMTLLVASCVVREDNELAPLLRVRAIAWVGTVSYGIYLVHMLSVSGVRRVLGGFGVVSPGWDFMGGAMLSIAVASLSYVTFERFFLGLKERWFTETPARPVKGTPSAPDTAATLPARATGRA